MTGPNSPASFSMPADTPPPAYMPPDSDKPDAMEISKPTSVQHIATAPNFRQGMFVCYETAGNMQKH